jgi:DNA primase
MVNLIIEIEQCGFATANDILGNIWEDDFSLSVVENKGLPPSLRQHEVILPPILNEWSGKYLAYLYKRDFDALRLIKKYKLMPAHRFGHYSHRIIVPFFVSKKLVTFTGMDTTGKKEVKYKDCSKEDSVIPTDETLYNIDNARSGKVVIVEGVTDVWRIGDGAVALNTNKISDSQLLQLKERDIKKVLVLLDADVNWYDVATVAGLIVSANFKTDVATLERDDPDKMPIEELIRVQKWLS